MNTINYSKLSLGILFILLLAQCSPKLYKAGKEYMKMRKYEEAAYHFGKWIESDPENHKAYAARAEAYKKDGQFQKSVEDFERAIVFKPKESVYHYEAGNLNYELGNYDKALKQLNKATSLELKYLPAYQSKIKVMMAEEDYYGALKVSDTSLMIKNNALNNYQRGLIYTRLNVLEKAEKHLKRAIRKEKEMIDAYVTMGEVMLGKGNTEEAMEYCNEAIEINKQYKPAYTMRSKIYLEKLDFQSAINDISRNIAIDPEDKKMYMLRGNYYFKLKNNQDAINDFTKAIALDDNNADAYIKRAKAYEETGNYTAAVKDYKKLTTMAGSIKLAEGLLQTAEKKLFELNKEDDKPQIILVSPMPKDNIIPVKGPRDQMIIKGKIVESSGLHYVKVNDEKYPFQQEGENFVFLADLDLTDVSEVVIEAADVYDNVQINSFKLQTTENNPPQISLIDPYASDNGEIFIDSDLQSLFIQGKVNDENTIESILIDGVQASFKVGEKNPKFTASLDITNKRTIIIKAADKFGNEKEQVFSLNRTAADLTDDNPMGKTWVVFIENSNYHTFASLEGPIKDIGLMKSALAKYQVHNVIHKKDMTKEQMERFFSIELRDLVRSNRVNSILIWYAGHGKFINETGYWIPVDAKRDDEFTYFNINALKASMQSYSKLITHTLVITDACESGPSFYQAMRSTPEERDCNDWKATKFKSSQVFSSAGYELAVDDSQFTRTFANALTNNPNYCMPIESIVKKVTNAVKKNNRQKPQFGKIAGLEDQNGTFFFIAKE